MENLNEKTLKRIVELLLISESKVDCLYRDVKNLREEIKVKKIDGEEIVKRLNEILHGINQM
jgi:hypothetical protein